MHSPGKKRLIAVTTGVVLVCASTAALGYWQRVLVDQLGQDEVQRATQRMIEIAEYRIGAVAALVEDLLRQGAVSCGAQQVYTIQRAAFANPWVKEISVVGSDDLVRCSSASSVIGPRTVLAANGENDAARATVGVIRVGDTETMIRVMKQGSGGYAIAALIPAALLRAETSRQKPTPGISMRLIAAGGAVIIEAGNDPTGAATFDHFRAQRMSGRFGLVATASLPRFVVKAQTERGRTLVIVLGAIAVILVIAFISVMLRRRSDPLSEFERAIVANEFVPYYQPIVDIRTGRLRGAEVLIRWRKPDGTLVVPGSFIPFAESSGLIVPMTRALMRRVCEEMGDVLANRPDIKIGFNLAARHFLDDAIVADVREIFGRSAIRLRQVVLEVTERQPLENLAAARRVIASLQEIGCGVAIDDVGTGHAGLSYMLKLGADTIKIDKMFIDGIGTEHYSTKIIESLVDLARNMRMEVVAEGVESFEQVLKLRDLGILAAQGHAFCPPIPASSLVQLVEAIAPLRPAGRPHTVSASCDLDEDELLVAAA